MIYTIDDVPIADMVSTLIAHLDTCYPAQNALTFDWLLEALQHEYSCQFVVREFRARGSLSGACMLLNDDSTYVLYVSAAAPRVKQKWILGHELGHVICGHFRNGRRFFTKRIGVPLTRVEAEAEAVAVELMKLLLYPSLAAWSGAGDAQTNPHATIAAPHHTRVTQLFTRLGC
jgi:Zn-dependent peptidase ImmA (M78 family)